MSNNESKPVVILGAGGHASALVDILKEQYKTVLAVVGNAGPNIRSSFAGIDILELDADVKKFNPKDVMMVNGIGHIPGSSLKQTINENFKALGYEFCALVSNSAHVAASATIADGVQILNLALVNSGSNIENDCIINSHATVEHDCVVGCYSHIGPNATLCGGVKVGKNCFIGAGAVILPGIEIGDYSIVGAGTIVTKDINKNLMKFSNISYIEKAIKHD